MKLVEKTNFPNNCTLRRRMLILNGRFLRSKIMNGVQARRAAFARSLNTKV